MRIHSPTSRSPHRSELTAVYRVDGGVVRLQQIRIGRRYADRVEVLAGLASGDTIALDPVRAGVYLRENAPSAE